MGLELVSVISSYLKHEKPCVCLTSALIEDAKDQGLGALLYASYKDDRIKSIYFNSLILQERFIKLTKYTSNLLNKYQIKHLIIKGSVLYKLYDDIAIRSRGDIDIYVSPEDYEKTLEIMIKNGFIEGDTCNHHTIMYYNELEVEIHFTLFEPTHHKLLKYFKNPFDFAINKDNYMYEFKPDYHFIYSLAHFKNHLVNGSGFRYLLDFYYMLTKTQLDLDFIKKELAKIDLLKLYNNIINALYEISGVALDNVEHYDVSFFLNYLNESGTYGFKRHKTNDMVPKNKLRLIVNTLFMPNKEYRIKKYPHLGRHWFFYPIMLIHRLLYLLTHKLKSLFRIVFRSRDKEEKELFKKIGI